MLVMINVEFVVNLFFFFFYAASPAPPPAPVQGGNGSMMGGLGAAIADGEYQVFLGATRVSVLINKAYVYKFMGSDRSLLVDAQAWPGVLALPSLTGLWML
jgi:hypothetical protein